RTNTDDGCGSGRSALASIVTAPGLNAANDDPTGVRSRRTLASCTPWGTLSGTLDAAQPGGLLANRGRRAGQPLPATPGYLEADLAQMPGSWGDGFESGG